MPAKKRSSDEALKGTGGANEQGQGDQEPAVKPTKGGAKPAKPKPVAKPKPTPAPEKEGVAFKKDRSAMLGWMKFQSEAKKVTAEQKKMAEQGLSYYATLEPQSKVAFVTRRKATKDKKYRLGQGFRRKP